MHSEPATESVQQGDGIVHLPEEMVDDDRVERLLRLVVEDVGVDVRDVGVARSELCYQLGPSIESDRRDASILVEPFVPDAIVEAEVEHPPEHVLIQSVPCSSDEPPVDGADFVALYLFVVCTCHEMPPELCYRQTPV